jgi:hypothetical protein
MRHFGAMLQGIATGASDGDEMRCRATVCGAVLVLVFLIIEAPASEYKVESESESVGFIDFQK